MQRGSATLFAIWGTLIVLGTVGLFAGKNLPLGTPGGKVIRDPSAATIPITLTTDVTGVLPIANGGTNNSSAYTAGSVIISSGTALTQNNSNLFFDSTNLGLGVGTGTVGANTRLGVAGSAVIKGIFTVEATSTASSVHATSTLAVASSSPSASSVLSANGAIVVGSTSNGTSTITGYLRGLSGTVSKFFRSSILGLAAAGTQNIKCDDASSFDFPITADTVLTFDNCTGNSKATLQIFATEGGDYEINWGSSSPRIIFADSNGTTTPIQFYDGEYNLVSIQFATSGADAFIGITPGWHY